jgi:chromosomal replication initiation ATPase DnaA
LNAWVSSLPASVRCAVRKVLFMATLRTAPKHDTISQTVVLVAEWYAITPEALKSCDKRYSSHSCSWARRVCMYLLRRTGGHTTIQIGAYFNRDYSTVSKAVMNLQRKAQTDPQLQLHLDLLARKLECMDEEIRPAQALPTKPICKHTPLGPSALTRPGLAA